MQAPQCPNHAFVYNTTQCACGPGYLYNLTSDTCMLFTGEPGPSVSMDSGVNYDISLGFPETIFSFDSIKKFTQSQAVFLEATLVMLLCWLGFCAVLRFFPLRSGDGRTMWFKIRWWISRLDVTFATRHWLNDQKAVVKRKTELGGMFSIASWILFIGLFAALLYQIISKRSVEVHNVRATNAPDLDSFLNDLQFNITTISSMSCANLRGLGTIVTGNPGFVDYRFAPLSTFANYSCVNTSTGPTITLQCNDCKLFYDYASISWQFVDLPNNPATAVGFQFNLTAKNRARQKHLSSVTGILVNASNIDDKPVTYRGRGPNVLKFNLFPRIYHNLHDLKLIQPLFHEFLPGSFFGETNQLQASLENSNDGLINTTFLVNFLSSYIIEIDNQNIMGPVSFLADLGGLYCISIGIFFFFLVQFEYRIKKLRYEDSVMRQIKHRRKARDHWDKLRKYVRFTWGSSLLEDNFESESNEVCCTGVAMKSFPKSGSSTRRMQKGNVAISFKKKVTTPNDKKVEAEDDLIQEVQPCSTEAALNKDKGPLFSKNKPEGHTHGVGNIEGICFGQSEECGGADIADLPPIPQYEAGDSGEIDIMNLQRNLQKLYEYNAMLREALIAAHSRKEPCSSVQ